MVKNLLSTKDGAGLTYGVETPSAEGTFTLDAIIKDAHNERQQAISPPPSSTQAR